MMSQSAIAVLGAGISGLAAAHRLTELAPQVAVDVFEASSRVGGTLETIVDGGYLCERSADNFIANVPWAIDLCRRIGLADELLPTNAARRKAFIVWRGKLADIPAGFSLMAPARWWPIASSRLLSPAGKLRMAAERFIAPRKEQSDESLASFAIRRWGREAYERLVQPLVSGIYTADPDRLSMAAALPRFWNMERRYGSLTRGMAFAASEREEEAPAGGSDDLASGVRYSLFVAPRYGMSQIIDRLEERLAAAPRAAIHKRTAIIRIECERVGERAAHWYLTCREGIRRGPYSGLIVALPAPAAAQALRECDDKLASAFDEIEYAGATVLCYGYRNEQLKKPLGGFGCVVPQAERRPILSISAASNKFPGRAPEGCTLLRVFVGGALQPELVDADDAELDALARKQLAELLGASGEPHWRHVARWRQAMPQYHVGHADRIARLRALAERRPGLALAGNAYEGVGIPQCVRSGEEAAAQVLAWMNANAPR